MRPWFTLALAALAIGAAPINALAVTVQAVRYGDFRQLLAREASTESITLAMTLRLPDEARDRYPAVAIVHTIAGYQEADEGWHAEQFRKAGFATLTYSSVAARRLRAGQISGRWPSVVAEAHAAFRLLADHPRIDAQRIAIVRISFGGEVAYLTALEESRTALVTDGGRFAAHVAHYPAGVNAPIAGVGIYTGAPILMLLGENDDNLPIVKVEDHLAYARTAGAPPPLEVVVYPDACHAWTVPSLGAPAFYEQYASTRKCPFLLVGPSPPTVLVDRQERPVEPGTFQACLKEGKGYSMAYDEGIRAMSLRDALAFLQKQLGP